MAIGEGITEVADSDEELMTSSPFLGADDVPDKLPAMASSQLQEPQDTIQNLHTTLQALGQDDANFSLQGTAILSADRRSASNDFDAFTLDQTDVKFEGAVTLQKEPVATQISHQDLAIHAQMNSPGLAPRIGHVPVANSSMRQLLPLPGRTQPCTFAQTWDSNSAPKDACSKSPQDATNTCDSKAHDRRTHVGPSHVVRNGSSQSISEDTRQDVSEYSDIIYPSEKAVHRSQAMGISDTTRTLAAAATNSLPTSLTGSVSIPVAPKNGKDIHPDPDSYEIGGQGLLMNGVDSFPDTIQEPVARAFTPQIRTVPETPQVRSLLLQEVPQPSEASQGLDTGVTATEFTCKSQPQPPTGASPITVLTSLPKTPQEVTLSELKAQKASLLASLRNLPAIQVLMEEMASSDTAVDGGCDKPSDADIMNVANKIVKQHIKLLHEYNELKDVGQGLMGLIADQRGVRIVEVQEEFGVDAKD